MLLLSGFLFVTAPLSDVQLLSNDPNARSDNSNALQITANILDSQMNRALRCCFSVTTQLDMAIFWVQYRNEADLLNSRGEEQEWRFEAD